MSNPEAEYLERLIIITYLEVQQMKKALYAKLGIEDDSYELFSTIDDDLNKLLEQKNMTLIKRLDEWHEDRKRKK